MLFYLKKDLTFKSIFDIIKTVEKNIGCSSVADNCKNKFNNLSGCSAVGDVCDRRRGRNKGAKRSGSNTAIDELVKQAKAEAMLQQEA